MAGLSSNVLGDSVPCLPGITIEVEHPTTIGLGYALVGGFVAALIWS